MRRCSTDAAGIAGPASHACRTALLESLYASGIRIREALSMLSDATPPGTRMQVVREEGDKQPLVPYTRELSGPFARDRSLLAPIPTERPPLG
jgi:integrase/recombinase XerD